MKPRVFSGIQPSGSPTLGNYLGAIRNWAAGQDDYDNIFCVVDLHALTRPQDPTALSQRTWETAAMLLAAGIDPERSLLFVQSHVPAHSALAWLLNTITPMGWLNRMTQFKTIAGSERESVGAGVLNYPVLMAADILLYDAHFVPVGDDQKQHVELTRDIAERFNSLYGDALTVPQPLIPPVGARIMALDDPTKKMSKSEPAGAILLTDGPHVVQKKIARAQTDSLGIVRFDPAQAGLYNLLSMYQILSGQSREAIERHFEGQGYRAVKQEVADLLCTILQPIQERYTRFEQEPEIVDRILASGAVRARSLAAPVLEKVQDKMGLRAPAAR